MDCISSPHQPSQTQHPRHTYSTATFRLILSTTSCHFWTVTFKAMFLQAEEADLAPRSFNFRVISTKRGAASLLMSGESIRQPEEARVGSEECHGGAVFFSHICQ